MEFIYNRDGCHWCIVRCFFPCHEYEDGLVVSIDHDGDPSDDKFLMKVRAQFAKSIGVYYDIRTSEAAFPGPEDVFASCSLTFDEYVIEKRTKGYSTFPHRHHYEIAGKQKDNYNCGIIALKSSIQCMSQKYFKLRQNIIITKECNNMRRALVEFLKEFIEELNPKWNDDDDYPGQYHKPCEYSKTDSFIITKNISDGDTSDEDNNANEVAFTQIVRDNEITTTTLSKVTDYNKQLSSTTTDINDIPDTSNHLSIANNTVGDEQFTKLANTECTDKDISHISESCNNDGMRSTKIVTQTPEYLDQKASTQETINNNVASDANDGTSHSESSAEKEWNETENKVVGRGHYFQSEESTKEKCHGTIQDVPSVLDDVVLSDLGPNIVKRRTNKSILSQLMTLFSDSYIVNGHGTNSIEFDKNTYFLPKMKQYDTYYMSTSINGTSTRKLICAAIIEIANMNQRQYRYEEKIDVEGHKTYDAQVTGYKTKSKVIFLHNIATPYDKRGNGYAKALLECIASFHFGKHVYMYWCKHESEEGNFIGKDYSSEDFLNCIGFETDPKNSNYRLMLVDNDNVCETPFVDGTKLLYRNSTDNIRSLNIAAGMDESIEYLELGKDSFLKIVFMQQVDNCEDLDFIVNNIGKRSLLDVSKNIKECYSLKGEKEWKKRKMGIDNHSDTIAIGKDDSTAKGSVYNLYGYNAFFGWRQIDESVLPISLVRMAKQHADKVLSIPAGHRSSVIEPLYASNHDISINNICLPPVKRSFRMKSRSDLSYGACQWISAAMLIDTFDCPTARDMMSHLNSDMSSFKWKSMYKGNDSLSTVIRKKTKYNLVKMKINARNYIPLLKSVNNGRYVCVLQDNNYGQNHVVGINCDSKPKMIWDCAEVNALLFTKQNLDRCVGHGMVCIAIKCIGEIKRK